METDSAKSSDRQALVQVTGLARHFDVSPPFLNRVFEGKPRQIVKAVDGIDFSVLPGQTFSLVGESGCGKSTVARLIVGLYQPTRGDVIFDGVNLGGLKSRSAVPQIQSRMQMIFQDPYASLNPRWRVMDIIAEPITVLKKLTGRNQVRARVGELLEQVGLSAADGEKFPHEFSGGQRQRISIARALAGEPEFLVCDEPTSALDVSVQAQVLNLFKSLQQEFALTYLFITHDLAVVSSMANRIGVLNQGSLVEEGSVQELFTSPKKSYTRMLMNSAPKMLK